MSHSAHRYGAREELQDDYVIFVRPCKQFDDVDQEAREETIRKTEALAGLVRRHDPVNFGRTKPGSLSQGVTFSRIMSVKALNGFMCVFTSKSKAEEVIRDIKEADSGLSVVAGGPHEDIFEIARGLGIQPHTVFCSLGIWGNTGRLPGENHLKIMTLCGHSMIPASLIDHMVDRIRSGRMSVEAAADELARPCPCGIFNVPKTIEILKKMTGDESGGQPAGEGE